MDSEVTAQVGAPPELERAQSLESNGLKRRRSEEGEQGLKRQRTSPGKNSPNATEDATSAETTGLKEGSKPPTEPSKAERTAETRDSRRKSSIAQEKQRGKRLFGALLGNLNQPSDRMTKRRAEIEQRRKAELKKQDDKRIEDRQIRLDKLAEHRRKEQEKLDEENMYRRHDDMLNKARFLLTTAEPRVYYRPWELLPHQEDIIEDQIRDAKVRIDGELAELEERKRQRDRRDAVAKDLAPTDDAVSQRENADEEVSNTLAGDIETSTKMIDSDEQRTSEPTEATKAPPEVNNHSEVSNLETDDGATGQVASASPEKDGKTESNVTRDESEDDEDHVVEGDEDTVIY